MSGKRILFATLNWGLGHSTRSIALIRHFRQEGHEIFLASDGDAGLLLRQEFPDLPYFSLPSFHISYPRHSFLWHWALQLPRFSKIIRQERARTKDLMQKYHFDTIISDNRYGLFHQGAKNILITHQLTFTISQPYRRILNHTVRSLVNRFDQCWIPDFPEGDLSGILSQGKLKVEKIYLGPLSRFSREICTPKYDVGVLISGPEPWRSDFQNELLRALTSRELKIFWVLGLPGSGQNKQLRSDQTFNHLPSSRLNQMLNETKVVISRSGYSSIMDYYILSKKAILVPTPLQPEQKFLAQWHKNRSDVFVPAPNLSDLTSGLKRLLDQKHEDRKVRQPLFPRL